MTFRSSLISAATIQDFSAMNVARFLEMKRGGARDLLSARGARAHHLSQIRLSAGREDLDLEELTRLAQETYDQKGILRLMPLREFAGDVATMPSGSPLPEVLRQSLVCYAPDSSRLNGEYPSTPSINVQRMAYQKARAALAIIDRRLAKPPFREGKELRPDEIQALNPEERSAYQKWFQARRAIITALNNFSLYIRSQTAIGSLTQNINQFYILLAHLLEKHTGLRYRDAEKRLFVQESFLTWQEGRKPFINISELPDDGGQSLIVVQMSVPVTGLTEEQKNTYRAWINEPSKTEADWARRLSPEVKELLRPLVAHAVRTEDWSALEKPLPCVLRSTAGLSNLSSDWFLVYRREDLTTPVHCSSQLRFSVPIPIDFTRARERNIRIQLAKQNIYQFLELTVDGFLLNHRELWEAVLRENQPELVTALQGDQWAAFNEISLGDKIRWCKRIVIKKWQLEGAINPDDPILFPVGLNSLLTEFQGESLTASYENNSRFFEEEQEAIRRVRDELRNGPEGIDLKLFFTNNTPINVLGRRSLARHTDDPANDRHYLEWIDYICNHSTLPEGKLRFLKLCRGALPALGPTSPDTYGDRYLMRAGIYESLNRSMGTNTVHCKSSKDRTSMARTVCYGDILFELKTGRLPIIMRQGGHSTEDETRDRERSYFLSLLRFLESTDYQNQKAEENNRGILGKKNEGTWSTDMVTMLRHDHAHWKVVLLYAGILEFLMLLFVHTHHIIPFMHWLALPTVKAAIVIGTVTTALSLGVLLYFLVYQIRDRVQKGTEEFKARALFIENEKISRRLASCNKLPGLKLSHLLLGDKINRTKIMIVFAGIFIAGVLISCSFFTPEITSLLIPFIALGLVGAKLFTNKTKKLVLLLAFIAACEAVVLITTGFSPGFMRWITHWGVQHLGFMGKQEIRMATAQVLFSSAMLFILISFVYTVVKPIVSKLIECIRQSQRGRYIQKISTKFAGPQVSLPHARAHSWAARGGIMPAAGPGRKLRPETQVRTNPLQAMSRRVK
ncbi:MAG TPA: hypothetical protein VJB02_04040 [Coxiellaceae bacterium]|nr:hypothetical protein [Coxiellaceae bacterium]